MANPIDKLVLYIATKIIKTIRIKFPKIVLNKLTKSMGIKNKTNHNPINNVNIPTKKLIFFLANRSFNNLVICIL